MPASIKQPYGPRPGTHVLSGKLPDLIVFALGIVIAGWLGWDTRGLVWGLWLASLVVGSVSILIGVAAAVGRARTHLHDTLADAPRLSARMRGCLVTVLALLYGAFLLAFFSLHFGGFHWGHSVFLNMFFPIDGGDPLTRSPMPRTEEYLQVLKLGAWFIPLALVAERARLFARTRASGACHPSPLDERMSAPYRNVVRLHLLIFVFAFASFAGVGGQWIYLLVYTVYFFPLRVRWRGRHRAVTPDNTHR